MRAPLWLARMPAPPESLMSFCKTSASVVPGSVMLCWPWRRSVNPTIASHDRLPAVKPYGRTETQVSCAPGESPPRFTYKPLPATYDQWPLGRESGGSESGWTRVPSTSTCPGATLTPAARQTVPTSATQLESCE